MGAIYNMLGTIQSTQERHGNRLEAVHFRFLAQAVAAPGGRILHGLREPYRSQLLAQGAIAISGIDGGSLDGGSDQAGGMFVSPTDLGCS